MPGVAYDAIADIAHGEDSGLAARLEHTVADLVNERLEMKRARVPHPPGAFDEHLRLGQVFFRPVHSKTKRVSLMVVRAKCLAAQLPILACHAVCSSGAPAMQSRARLTVLSSELPSTCWR
jgi:hypothetical protein